MKAHALTPVYFHFENDFVDSLRCIPMIVRYKLDTCGIKLKLPQWVKFSVAEKRELAALPCFTSAEIAAYRLRVGQLVETYFQLAASELPTVDASWENLREVPDEVQQKALEWKCAPIFLSDWLNLDMLQRFALVKLSRSGHEGRNFPRALREFGIG
ncbi:nitrate reductase associated protein [Larkinella harenae]